MLSGKETYDNVVEPFARLQPLKLFYVSGNVSAVPIAVEELPASKKLSGESRGISSVVDLSVLGVLCTIFGSYVRLTSYIRQKKRT